MTKIHELFNADGNDDILSDIGGSAEIRQGMAATTPDAVLSEVYDVAAADRIALQIKDRMNLPRLERIKGGEFGVAYDIGNGMVLKITKDTTEAAENSVLIGKPLKYIAQPYKVLSIKSRSGDIPETHAIILEKLKTDPERFKRLFQRIDVAFNQIMDTGITDAIEYYIGKWDNGKVDRNKIENYLKKNPEDAGFFYGLVNIGREALNYGVESMDYLNYENLGYKKNGALGFFDVGWGNTELQPQGAEKVEVDEDGSSIFSTDDAVGQDGFPPYNQNDTSHSLENNLYANMTMYNEDLEYNHASDATKDEFVIDERVLSSMPGSSTVDVKKKCRLGGLGNTSAACNQGDISNLDIKPLKETVDIQLPAGEINGYQSFKITDDGRVVGEIGLINRDNGYLTVDKIFINDNERGRGYADEAMRILFDYADRYNKIITLTPDNLWGANVNKLKRWYQSLGFVMNKGRRKDFLTMQLMYRLPKSTMNEAQLMSLQDLPFKADVEAAGGGLHSVGGAVRDEFLGRESKDLDILVTGIPMDELERILSRHGRVNAVGKSFGILKFKPEGGEEIDVAIPRTEKPTGAGGHQDFNVASDHALPVEKDLERRDFTINAIAKDSNGNIIDPYGGREDLKNKLIRAVNPQAFSDDPLRMLRAVQFAARFGFTIEPGTMKMIQDTAGRIKNIPPERILIEFDKIVKKGDKRTGAQLLKDTGLFQNIFGFDIKQSTIDRSPFEEIKTMGEFIYLLIRLMPNPAGFYKNKLRGDIDTYKEVRAYETAFNSAGVKNPVEARSVAHNMYVMSPRSLQSGILPNGIKAAARELLQGRYPRAISDLAVNGNDLMKLGLKGSEIGDMMKTLLLKVYADKIGNNREELINSVQRKNALNEDVYRNTVNGDPVDIGYFVDRYDQWNAGGRFHDPSKESVLRFLEDEFPGLIDDERLKNELRWLLSDREVLNEGVEERPPLKRVSYTGVILDKESRKQLLKVFKTMIPEGWEVVAHHMTIRLDELDPGSKEYQDMKGNKTITLNVVDYAINDKVMAIGVTGYPSESVKPHITLAVDRAGGGKPAMSKELTDWRPLGFRFKVTGKIEEVENQPLGNMINEMTTVRRDVKRLAVFDFDGTLVDSPQPETGKQMWSEKTGMPYQDKAWWSRPESLDLNVFDIKPFPSVYKQYLKERSTPGTLVIILTSRLEELRPQVEAVLEKNNIRVDGIDMKDGNTTKGQQVLNYIRMYGDLEEINVYEDRDVELETYESVRNRIPEGVAFNVYTAHKGGLALTESELLEAIREEIQKLI
jgi:tRNA nucleotidyltransferase/poly(A) polymerase